jgi:hypothetical protein
MASRSKRFAPILVIVIVFVILLTTFFTFNGLLSSADQARISISETEVSLDPKPLNYSAYEIMIPSTAVFSLRYFFSNGTSGSLEMTPGWGNVTIVNNSIKAYNICSEEFDTQANNCGFNIIPEMQEITYHANQSVLFDYMIDVTNNTRPGLYLFFPAGEVCGSLAIYLILGSYVPKTLPRLSNTCSYAEPTPVSNISIMAVQGSIGLDV